MTDDRNFVNRHSSWAGFNWFRLFVISLFTLSCVLFAAAYVGNETPGYFWDFATYYDQLSNLKDEVGGGHWRQVVSTLIHTRGSDYNISPILPLLPIFLLFGLTRLAYILSLVVLYLVPACIVLVLLIRECWSGTGRGIPFLFGLGFVLIYPMFWVPTLRGYPDIAALVPMGVAGLILLRTQWTLRASSLQCLVLGLLLWCSFLFRRHFAYSIVAMIVCTLVFAGFHIAQAPGIRKHLIAIFLRNSCIAGAALSIPALIIQGPLIRKILSTSYENVYAAYQKGFFEKLTSVYNQNGLFWTVLVVLGCLYTIYLRNEKLLFCLSIGIFSYSLFQRTQAPDIHHTLPFAFWLAPIAVWPLSIINTQFSAPFRSVMHVCFLSLTWLISFPSLAWAGLQRNPPLSWTKPLQASTTYPPFQLKNYSTLVQLVNQLEEPEFAHKSVLVLASSFDLNPSIVVSLRPGLRSRLVNAGDVDLRDGFSLSTVLNADYIVTTRNPSIHLPWKHQQVIVIPSRALFDSGNPFSRLFQPIPSRIFTLTDGNSIHIFKRTSRPTAEASRWLSDEFRKQYPSWQSTNGMLGP